MKNALLPSKQAKEIIDRYEDLGLLYNKLKIEFGSTVIKWLDEQYASNNPDNCFNEYFNGDYYTTDISEHQKIELRSFQADCELLKKAIINDILPSLLFEDWMDGCLQPESIPLYANEIPTTY